MLEDYRAGLCVAVIPSTAGAVSEGPTTIARINSGHHMAEKNPAEVAEALTTLLNKNL